MLFQIVYCQRNKENMATVPLMLIEEDVERGGKEQSEPEIQSDFAYRNNVHNADINIRMGNCMQCYINLKLTYKIAYIVTLLY